MKDDKLEIWSDYRWLEIIRRIDNNHDLVNAVIYTLSKRLALFGCTFGILDAITSNRRKIWSSD